MAPPTEGDVKGPLGPVAPSGGERSRVILLAATAGLALFAYTLWSTGLGPILRDVAGIGTGFLVVLALAGIREVVRTLSWLQCLPAAERPPFREAFAARIGGEALGNLTPLSLLVSEPAKAMLVRHRVSVAVALPALAVEQFFYSLTVGLVIACGLAAMLVTVPLATPLETIGVVSAAGMVALATLMLWVAWAQPRVAAASLRWLEDRELVPRWLGRRVGEIRALEERLYTFGSGSRRRTLAIASLLATFHAAGVAEVYASVWLLSGSTPSLLVAFVLETVNRFITVIFKIVPFRVGVDEAGSGLVIRLLGYGAATGVALALVRKARVLTWTAVGVAVLVHRGWSVRTAMSARVS
jgi:hypothetical protein